jgi:hypothetical protein
VRLPPDPVFPNDDKANDDPDDTDESNNVYNNHIYSFDAPGAKTLAVATGGPDDKPMTQWIMRANFKEYVRVSFNGTFPTGNTLTGSRCSYKQRWHCFFWLEEQNGIYVEKAGKQNDVDLQWGQLDPAPTP